MSNARKLADNLPAEGSLSGRNILINGAHAIDQRNSGSSATVTNGADHFIADRFRFTENSSATFSAQRVADAPVGFEYSSKITVTGTDTSLSAGEFHRILQGIEGQNISHLDWGSANAKTLTLTFYVKSSLTGQYYVAINNSAVNRRMLKGYTIDSANTWEKKTITITGDTSGTWLTTNGVGIYLMWSLGTGSSYQSNDVDSWQGSFAMAKSDQVNFGATNGATWQLTGCQLEVGSQASPHENEPYSVTLAKCQRYFFLETTTATDSSGRLGVGSGAATVVFDHTLPVQMRAKPSVSLTNANIRIGDMVAQGFTTSSGTVSLNTYSGSQSVTYILGGFSGLTSYRSYLHEPDGSSTGMVKFDAEL